MTDKPSSPITDAPTIPSEVSSLFSSLPVCGNLVLSDLVLVLLTVS